MGNSVLFTDTKTKKGFVYVPKVTNTTKKEIKWYEDKVKTSWNGFRVEKGLKGSFILTQEIIDDVMARGEYDELAQCQIVKDVDFSNCNLSKITLHGKFVGCNFTNANLTQVDMKSCEFKNCIFNNASIYCDAGDSTFKNCQFVNVAFTSTFFENCKFENVDFTGSNMRHTAFYLSSMTAICFAQATLYSCHFVQSTAKQISGLDVDNIVFGGATSEENALYKQNIFALLGCSPKRVNV